MPRPRVNRVEGGEASDSQRPVQLLSPVLLHTRSPNDGPQRTLHSVPANPALSALSRKYVPLASQRSFRKSRVAHEAFYWL